MISTIFETIGQAVTSFVSVLGNGVNGVTSMFMTESSGSYTLTFLGTLLLIAAGVGIVYWAFRLIRSLVARA